MSELQWGRASLAYGAGMFLGTVILGALLVLVLQDPINSIFGQAAQITNQPAANTGIGWTRDIWAWAPFWILLLGLVGLLARASAERQRGRF